MKWCVVAKARSCRRKTCGCVRRVRERFSSRCDANPCMKGWFFIPRFWRGDSDLKARNENGEGKWLGDCESYGSE